jgi:hypothetical protein
VTLQLHSDASGLVHYLSGKPVRGGDVIEVLLNGQWTTVEYRWPRASDCNAIGVIEANQTTLVITLQMEVRWPEK